MSPSITIDKRRIGPGEPAYVIAEISANHNGSKERALDLVRLAARTGTDAIKLQTYTADTLTFDGPGPEFTIKGGTQWDGRKLYELYQEAYTPWEWHGELFAEARKLGVTIFSSPFDATAVDFLEELDCPAYKIASPEIIDLELIQKAAATGKPLVISTGMATLGEIEEALAAARDAGAREIALLKCTSAYPAKHSEMNLRALRTLSDTFGVPVGLSDHSPGSTVAVAAAAIGGCIIEKHFTRLRSEGGPDATFSMEPDEFTAMIEAVRTVHAALGESVWIRTPSEDANRPFRRSLYAVKDIAAGEAFTRANVASIRPANGLEPKAMGLVLSRKARTAIAAGTPLSMDQLMP